MAACSLSRHAYGHSLSRCLDNYPEEPAPEQLNRKLSGPGHTLRRDESIGKQAAQWTLQGRGRPRNTWKGILRKKCGRQASGRAGVRWRRKSWMELSGLWPMLYWQ